MKRALILVFLVSALFPTAAVASAKPALRAVAFQPRLIHLTRPAHRRTASCSAHTHTGAGVTKIARKVLPVACEQPPRSWLGLDLAKQAVTALAP